jgi:hypothetical protein
VSLDGHPAGLPSGRLLTLTFRRVSET